MQIQPYLCFYGRCEEALNFYQQALGAKILFMLRAKDAPGDYAVKGENGERIMHATLLIGESTVMASDGNTAQEAKPHSGFNVSISIRDVAEGKKIFDALSQGAQISFPWQKTFWTEGFGMLTDKFGIPWMVNVEHEESQA
jgi:PhnB protein